MDTEKLEANIEFLSEQVHNAWMKEKLQQGFHAPKKCHTYFEGCLFNKFEKRCDKCHTDMYPYSELPENIKDYDRVTVRTVIEAIKKM